MELTECINYLLSVSQNKVFKHFSGLLEPFGLTPAQYGVLNCLWREGQLSPKQIAESMHLEATTVSGILDKMQKAGFIERSIDPSNRRNVWVVATPKAISIREQVESATTQMNQAALQNVSPSDRAALLRGLTAIVETEL